MNSDRQIVSATPAHPAASSGFLQRKCACGNHTVAGAQCGECKKQNELQRRAAGGSNVVDQAPQIVYDVLRSPGQPLDNETRTFFESRFSHNAGRREQKVMSKAAQSGLRVGSADDALEQEADHIAAGVLGHSTTGRMGQPAGYDFSQVRVHFDSHAAESARAVGALAYTVGSDVVFGAGQYAPRTGEGRKLLAHELAHTVQQTNGLSRSIIQRMAPCPATYPRTLPAGWKPYYGDSCVFHCCYNGILEDRRPTSDDPQNECFYDRHGTLVDENHPYAGCRGTPNQYDSSTNRFLHFLIDRGGIVRSGLGAFATSSAHHLKPASCAYRCSRMPGAATFECFQACMRAE